VALSAGIYLHGPFEFPTTEQQKVKAKELRQYLHAVDLAMLPWGWQVAAKAAQIRKWPGIGGMRTGLHRETAAARDVQL
jgi:hypothetical protein